MNPDPSASERLVIRDAHGELTDEESHRLDRLLPQDPDLRRARDDYVRIDRLTEAALRTVTTAATTDPDAHVARPPRAGATARGPRARWVPPLAIAASIGVALLIPSDWIGTVTTPRSGGGALVDPVQSAPLSERVPRPVPAGMDAAAPMHLAGTGPKATHRSTARDVVAVISKDGKTVYWIELDRTRTTQVRHSGTRDASTAGGS